jgi:HK97 family phage prohead protease
MPYFITDKAESCSGWATIKDDGEVIGCHTTKQEAIDQMVAVSLAEDIEVGGERIESGPQAVIVDIDGTLISNTGELIDRTYNFLDDMSDTEIFIVTARVMADRDSTIAELDSLSIDYDRLFMKENSSVDSVEFKKATATKLLEEYNIILAIDNNPDNRAAFRELGITALDVSDVPEVPSDESNDDEEDVRAINQDAPSFMRAAARRGLAFNADGLAGDGLTDKTVREARLMADGKVSDDKWIRIAAWIARHMPDLDAPAASPSNENYPSAGVVAHFLWGSGATKEQARRTMAYAERVVERIRAEQQDRNAEQNEKWKTIALNLNKDERQQMTTTVERRVNTVEFDVRNGEASSDGMSFTGYAAVFDSPSEPLPFTEVIKGGAFQRSLKSRNEIKLFMNHNTDVVLGSSRAGTLRLSEDSRGLLAEADLPDTTAGRDLSVLMQRGDVNSMSFGFSVPPRGDKWSEDGATRELHQVRLHEVSIVTGFPAYQATTASVRSLDILATRTAVDVDALSDAITRLEAGETLEAQHADLISEVVSKLRADQPSSLELLELKRKQLDLMAKVF